jgi:hypothetical protein
MKRYIVGLRDGAVMSINGETFTVENGGLAILNGDEVIAAFAPGGWSYITVNPVAS